MNRKARVTEHPQRHASRIIRGCSVAAAVKHGEVARADKLYRTIAGSSPNDEGRELPRQGALAENAVGVLHQAIDRETGFGEAAKRCMEMAHEHRRGNTLAGNIAEHEEQAP